MSSPIRRKSASYELIKEEVMTKQMNEGSGKDSTQTDRLVSNTKDVSTHPKNEEGSVQPMTIKAPSDMERENIERESMRREEERKHHEEIGS